MTPQESALLHAYLSELVSAGQVPQDPQAAAMIQQAARAQPDALYLVVQRSLIQQQALEVAQQRIADLERAARPAPAAEAPSSFLSSLGWGRSKGAAAAQPAAPAGGGFGNSAGAGGGYNPAARQGAPMAAASGAPGAAGSRAGGFLGQAAAMAAGVAGGAFLFQGIQNLMGHGGGEGGFLNPGGLTPQTENVTVNEFIEDPSANSDPGAQGGDADWDSSADSGGGYADDGGGFDGGGFDGGGDDFA